MYYQAKEESNDALVTKLIKNRIFSSKIVEKVMRLVDRGDFSADLSVAYYDSPHGIGHGQTISAPHMHSMCMELLESHITKKNARVLDVGSGSGYLTTCFGRMVGEGGKVIGIDVVSSLVDWGIKNAQKHHKDLFDSGVVTIKLADGWKGDPDNGPYDAIHVGAAADSIPKPLLQQMAVGGRMIIPVGTHSQKLIQVDRVSDSEYLESIITGVTYVPLVKNKPI